MIDKLLDMAAEEAVSGSSIGDGGPFGAVIADSEGKIISVGHNKVLGSHDPTNHAEVVAIREACSKLKTHDLSGYTIYSSCEPCPMCLGAVIWSNLDALYFGANRKDAARAGFRDDLIYEFLAGNNDVLKRVEVKNKSCCDVLDNYKGEIY